MSDYAEEGQSPSRFQEAMEFIYNKRTKEFLGRNAKSWALIGVFYLIYYLILAGFFCGMLAVFLNVIIQTNEPRLTGMQSLLKMNPGISFFPLPAYQSTLVRYSPKAEVTYAKYVEDIRARLKPISDTAKKSKARFATCNSINDTKNPNNDPMKVCVFEEKLLGDCSDVNGFGYKIGKPCIFIKMNKIYGWIPDVKNASSPYVRCEGETVADKENLGGVKYFPEMKIASAGNESFAKISNVFFPYLKQEGYVSPVAAIQFLNPTKNVLIMVRCSLLGLNNEEKLFVRMELLVEG